MVVVELVELVLRWLAQTFGLNGLAIGTTALATVGLYYLREAADVLVFVARYARMLSLVGAAFLVVLVVGTATGVLDLSADHSALGQLWRSLTDLLKIQINP